MGILGFSSPCSLIDDSTRALASAVLAQAVEDATVMALWPVSGIVHETWERDLWLETGAWFLDGEDGAEWFGGGIWQALVGVIGSRARADIVDRKRTRWKKRGDAWQTWTERNANEAERTEKKSRQEAHTPPVRRMPPSERYTTPTPFSKRFIQRNYGPKISILYCSDALDMEPSTILRLTAQRIIQTAIRTTFLRARQVAMAEIAGRRPSELFGDDWIALPSEEWFSPGARGLPLFEVSHGTDVSGGVIEDIRRDQIPFSLAWCCRHAVIGQDEIRAAVAESVYARVEYESEAWRKELDDLKGEGEAGCCSPFFSSLTLDAEIDLREVLVGGMRLASMDMGRDRRMDLDPGSGPEEGQSERTEQPERFEQHHPEIPPLLSLEDHVAVRTPAVEAILAMEIQRWQRYAEVEASVGV